MHTDPLSACFNSRRAIEFGDPVPEELQFPLDSYQLDWILNSDMTFDKMHMVEWVQEWSGCRNATKTDRDTT